MENEILDLEVSEVEFEKFRPVALILEFAPLLVGILGLAIGNPQMITIGFLTASLLYVVLSWYFFKGLKYSIWSILASTFFGMGIAVILIGFTFYFQAWEGYDLMVITGHLTLTFCLILSFCYMALMSWILGNGKYEFRMSQKIFSRFMILMIILYSLGLNRFMEGLF